MPGALSELTITTCGHLTWEYRPRHPTPTRMVAIILRLLDPAALVRPITELRPELTLMSLADRALAS